MTEASQTIKQITSPYDNKAIYFQKTQLSGKGMTAPSSKSLLASTVMQTTQSTMQNFDGRMETSSGNIESQGSNGSVDPLDYISLPDLFFGDQNYQNMLPTLEMPHNNEVQAQEVQYQGVVHSPQGTYSRPSMQPFSTEKVNDFKHVIYNLLVDNYNNPHKSNFVIPITIEENGVVRTGFCFNEAENPEKRLPELYAQHIRKARLEQEDISSVFVHDLYKFYLRASVELLSKYFEKRDKYTYLYEDSPLFLMNDTLERAEERIRNMKTRARKKRKLIV
jgi:hypothetical protein